MLAKKHNQSSFFSDKSGSIAITFAAGMIPALIAIGLSVDFGRALTSRQHLQVTVDAAALAAATYVPKSEESSGNMSSDAQRKAVAESILNASLAENTFAQNITFAVTIADDIVNVIANGIVPTTIGGIVVPKIDIGVGAKAKSTAITAPLCILALNRTADQTFKSWGSADLTAVGCAVHSNSSSDVGMVTGGTATADATQFCTTGGYTGGGFSPEPISNCPIVSDPHEGKYTVDALEAQGISIGKDCDYKSFYRPKKDIVFDAGGPSSVMSFCGGLNIKAGVTATFKPGVYVFYRRLEISSGGTLNAPEGVTFYFAQGGYQNQQDAELLVQGGGNLFLKAPTSGPLAGMAIVQPTVSNYDGGATPTVTHTIIGGGQVDIVGNVYTPQAKFHVTGNGEINANSTYFSVIADFVELEGNGILTITAQLDNGSNEMPPLESVAIINGAYLIK